MTFSYKIEQDASILIDVNGVEFYVGDDESPTKTIPLQNLVYEFLDSRSISEVVVDIEDVEKVRDDLQNALDEIKKALENSKNGQEK